MIKSLLAHSNNNKEKIMIFYMDSSNNVTQRFIKVLCINTDLIVAYCYWRKKIRMFRLENILSAGRLSGNRVGA